MIVRTEDMTPEMVRLMFDYDPETGALTWRITAKRGQAVGDRADSKGHNVYMKVSMFNTNHLAHRLAWIHYYGKHPECVIDHINRDRSDNRICNLRDVDYSTNAKNRGDRGEA